MNPKSTAKKADSVAKKDRRQKWSAASSFFEFVNATFHGRSTVVIARTFAAEPLPELVGTRYSVPF
jgi:hypothetical protein